MIPSAFFKHGLTAVLLLCCFSFTANAQTVLIDHHFNVATLPSGLTSDGVPNPNKAADPPCTQGMIQVNSGGYLQADVSSSGVFTVNMKSTSSSTRSVTIKYKKEGDAGFTTLTPALAVSVAATFNLTNTYPALISSIPISVRIEPANGNIQIHDLYVVSNATQSSAAEITAFKIPGQTGSEVINSAAGTIAISVPLGTALNTVTPQTVVISPQATINPSATAAQNFTNPVTYTVTAQSGTTKTWTITVTGVASAAKEIIAFKLANNQVGNAVIDSASGTISVLMPLGSNLNGLVPVTFTLSANATVSPATTMSQNFGSPVVYTVTAQNNSTKTWTINTTLVDPNTTFTDYQAEAATYTGVTDNQHAGYTGTGFIDFLAGGENGITFTVCQQQAGMQTAKFRYAIAKDDYRKGALFVNGSFVKLLDFPRTPAFTDWTEETTPVNLQAGVNSIKITWDTTDGPNLDKLMLSGAPCNSYTLNINATNGGSISKSPARTDHTYFEGEQVTLLAQSLPALRFDNWSGDLTGSANPSTITMNGNKTITGNFSAIPTYKLNVSVNGIGSVTLSPPGGEYAENTVVTITANSVLGSTFTGYSGSVTSANAITTVTMNSIKNVTAGFTSSYSFNFENVVGFAAATGDGFTTPARGGQCAPDSVYINGPGEFNKLCETLYYRQQAYKNGTTVNGLKRAPLVILLRDGIYDGTQTLSANGAKVFGNSMLDIPEQGDLTFMGESGVIFKIGINVKRSYNLLIRNIFFQDYYDDGINIGYPETHHIWIDHCTVGHPATLPINTEHPDGGIDVKDGASYVTISWCLIRNSWKTSLVGHSDNNGATDNGRLKVTYVNNYFYHTNSRNPRVRFGQVHVLNNLFDNVMLYGSVPSNGAQLFAENNFYLNTDWPMYADRTTADFKAVYGNNSDDVFTSKTGNYPCAGLKQSGNAYDDSGLPVITAQINPAMLNPGGRSVKFDELNPAAVFTPSASYTYTPLTANEVKVIVPIYAGADKVSFSTSCGSLPVTLLSFNAVWQNDAINSVKLEWKTTDEVNTAGFTIERSTDAIRFSAIGYVTAINTTRIHNYSFTDVNPVVGLSYYRLKQLDKDGKFTYSPIVAVNSKSNADLFVSPNPAVTNNLVLVHPAAKPGSIIRIISGIGKTVLTMNISVTTTRTQVNIAGLVPGMYEVIMQNGADRLNTKLIRQ